MYAELLLASGRMIQNVMIVSSLGLAVTNIFQKQLGFLFLPLWDLKKMLVGFSGSLVHDGHSKYGNFTFLISNCSKTIQKATLQN